MTSDESTIDNDPVQTGQLDTGSEWDGWPLCDIFNHLLTQCQSRAAAADLTDSIMINRIHALKEQEIMAFKKMTKPEYPPRLWALVGYPGSGKSTFATQMRAPILVIDAEKYQLVA